MIMISMIMILPFLTIFSDFHFQDRPSFSSELTISGQIHHIHTRFNVYENQDHLTLVCTSSPALSALSS